MMSRYTPSRIIAFLALALAPAWLPNHAYAAAIERIDLGKVLVAPGEEGRVTVVTDAATGEEGTLALRLHNIRGSLLHAESKALASAVEFEIPPQAQEGALLLTVTASAASGESLAERVYSVVSDPAADVRYGFYTNYSDTGDDAQAQTVIGESKSNGDASGPGIDTSNAAWGLRAYGGALAEAVRPLETELSVGNTFRFDWDLGFIESGSSVGASLQNNKGNALFELLFAGGDSNVLYSDAAGFGTSTLPFSSAGFSVEFTLTSSTSYTLVLTDLGSLASDTITGNLKSPVGGQAIDRIRYYNFNAAGSNGAAPQWVCYFNSLVVEDDATPANEIARDTADDAKYSEGFLSGLNGGSGFEPWNVNGLNYSAKARILADLHLNAIEYYDYFPGHGDYAPTEISYTNEPFSGQFIHTANIRGKADANRERNIANIAYIAAYSAIPEIAELTPDYLLNASNEPLVYFNGLVGTEADLGGVWFRLMAFAPDTAWFAFLQDELERALDDLPSDRVTFEGFEVDTYGYEAAYNSSGSAYNGQSISSVVAEFTGQLRDLTESIAPRGMVATNTISEAGIEGVYSKVDFLFVENWDFHKPTYEAVANMCYLRGAQSGLRLVSKSYPADTALGVSIFPESNLRYLLGAHLTGGGSFMVAGEPNESTGEIGGLNSLYYPDYSIQPASNYDAIRSYNAHDAALYGLNHGPSVVPRSTDLSIAGTLVRGFRAGDGSLTYSMLHLGEATHWTESTPQPDTLASPDLVITLPNAFEPADVLYGTPDDEGLIYPESISWARDAHELSCRIPSLEYYGSLIVLAQPLSTRTFDNAANAAYDNGWQDVNSGGSGWSSDWSFSGIESGTGVFLGSSTENGDTESNLDADIDLSQRSWGMFSGSSGLIDAVRDFPPLEADVEALRLHMDNGLIDTAGAVGFGLRNAQDTDLLEFYFTGGESGYTISDGLGDRITGIAFTDEGLDLEFRYTASGAYSLRVVPIGRESAAQTISGEMKAVSESPSVSRLRLFSFQAGSGPEHDTYFNEIAIYSHPVPVKLSGFVLD